MQLALIFGENGKVTAEMILCVDDEPVVLATRKLVLQSAGYRVITASDGREGLSLFRERSVNAVVLDYAMPDMDGGRVAAEMKQMHPEVPILMLSAHMFLPDNALENVDAYLTKIEGPVAMLNTLKSLLNEKKMGQGAA
jgi:two-component system alkaline phosphatase synthesis response regulator PhoP